MKVGRRLVTIAARQHVGHPRRRMTPAPDRHQTAHQVAHHVMQERVGAKTEVDEVALLPHVDLMEVLDRRLRLAIR